MRDSFSPGLPPSLAVPFGLVEDGFRRLTNLVKEMSLEALEYQGPQGEVNSTATLLAHLAAVDLDYLHVIMGVPVPEELNAEYGPYETEDGRLPVVTGQKVSDLLARYERVLELGRGYFRSRPESEAERPVSIPWWPQPATVRYVLWHMAGHSMFHQGQIRRLQLYHAGK